jgi:response regulator RpfG family c-di-GMP phosphodiesterase
MTGLAETEHIVHGLEAGGVDYVTKPIAIEEMLARIRVHLANARLTQSARAALDVSGRFLLAVNRQGRIMWATPQAQKLLSDNLAARASPDQRRKRRRHFPITSNCGCNIWASSAPMNSCFGWPRIRAPACPRHFPANWD